MHRRDYLAAVGSAGALALAGCTTGDGPGGGDGTTSTETTSTPTTSIPPTTAPLPTGGEPPSGWTFAVLAATCGSSGAATITVDGAEVSVTGTITAPNPCHGAELAAADLTDGTLALRVTTVDPAGTMGCVECVGAVDYEATGTLAAAPSRVVVEHASIGETRTVAEWSD